ncbi:agamous-like MADS-box protein AGL9 isoform X2 [Salvia divinorum]|uniref:Agamous-like MADS-box protein AGL9 isoform X2 n=1 Tax=Salvia divinorum TaxID=28513 RepID=A0ABD1I7D2_SALDI
MAKSEKRETAFSKRRASLFKKAHELAVLCDAQVAIIIISFDGKVYEFASSSMQEILTRYKACKELVIRNPLQLNQEKPEEEVPKEASVSGQKEDELKSRKLLGRDLTGMSSQELYVLAEKLKEGMLFIKDTKLQLLKYELEKSKMQEQQLVQKNQMLLRQFEELQNFLTRLYFPRPISVHCPATQLAITSSSETKQDEDETSLPPTSSETNQDEDETSLPSTSSADPTISDCSINHFGSTTYS